MTIPAWGWACVLLAIVGLDAIVAYFWWKACRGARRGAAGTAEEDGKGVDAEGAWRLDASGSDRGSAGAGAARVKALPDCDGVAAALEDVRIAVEWAAAAGEVSHGAVGAANAAGQGPISPGPAGSRGSGEAGEEEAEVDVGRKCPFGAATAVACMGAGLPPFALGNAGQGGQGQSPGTEAATTTVHRSRSIGGGGGGSGASGILPVVAAGAGGLRSSRDLLRAAEPQGHHPLQPRQLATVHGGEPAQQQQQQQLQQQQGLPADDDERRFWPQRAGGAQQQQAADGSQRFGAHEQQQQQQQHWQRQQQQHEQEQLEHHQQQQQQQPWQQRGSQPAKPQPHPQQQQEQHWQRGSQQQQQQQEQQQQQQPLWQQRGSQPAKPQPQPQQQQHHRWRNSHEVEPAARRGASASEEDDRPSRLRKASWRAGGGGAAAGPVATPLSSIAAADETESRFCRFDSGVGGDESWVEDDSNPPHDQSASLTLQPDAPPPPPVKAVSYLKSRGAAGAANAPRPALPSSSSSSAPPPPRPDRTPPKSKVPAPAASPPSGGSPFVVAPPTKLPTPTRTMRRVRVISPKASAVVEISPNGCWDKSRDGSHEVSLSPESEETYEEDEDEDTAETTPMKPRGAATDATQQHCYFGGNKNSNSNSNHNNNNNNVNTSSNTNINNNNSTMNASGALDQSRDQNDSSWWLSPTQAAKVLSRGMGPAHGAQQQQDAGGAPPHASAPPAQMQGIKLVYPDEDKDWFEETPPRGGRAARDVAADASVSAVESSRRQRELAAKLIADIRQSSPLAADGRLQPAGYVGRVCRAP
ncbi:hypothetical protein DIPPA_22478 [Diplonema papillatum]|nr:hypothetical protein DIPPA_22478 [Diplonema papillatum]